LASVFSEKYRRGAPGARRPQRTSYASSA